MDIDIESINQDIDKYIKKGTINEIFTSIKKDYMGHNDSFASGCIKSWDRYLMVLSGVERKLATIQYNEKLDAIKQKTKDILAEKDISIDTLYDNLENMQKDELIGIETINDQNNEYNENHKNILRLVCFAKYDKMRALVVEKQIQNNIDEICKINDDTFRAHGVDRTEKNYQWYCHLKGSNGSLYQSKILVVNATSKYDAYRKILNKLIKCDNISSEYLLSYLLCLKKNGIQPLVFNEDVLMFGL